MKANPENALNARPQDAKCPSHTTWNAYRISRSVCTALHHLNVKGFLIFLARNGLGISSPSFSEHHLAGLMGNIVGLPENPLSLSDDSTALLARACWSSRSERPCTWRLFRCTCRARLPSFLGRAPPPIVGGGGAFREGESNFGSGSGR